MQDRKFNATYLLIYFVLVFYFIFIEDWLLSTKIIMLVITTLVLKNLIYGKSSKPRSRKVKKNIVLQKLHFVDIYQQGGEYIYIYAVHGATPTKEVFMKFIFTSDIPHYLWTDIQKKIRQKGISILDLNENQAADIGIGKIEYTYFSENDFKKYSKILDNWKNIHKQKALDNQRNLCDEYDEANGRPELPQW